MNYNKVAWKEKVINNKNPHCVEVSASNSSS